ncbi:MAG: glycosyltransferase family 2 protein [Planctomycetes bacterium]|nr:glycosyltransferase family 2 protein [Planctomycetota bacterium]
MIQILAVILATVAYAWCQARLVRLLRDRYATPSANWPDGQAWPKAAIVLSLRGNDPFLIQCLQNLVCQDYPNFSIHLIVDSESDPAWIAIRTVREEFGEDCLNASVLRERLPTCGLKNSSLIQAIEELSDDCEVVAFVDADAITPPSWLRHLVTPLADPKVGGTTGVRWFASQHQGFGTRLRCFWNQFAAATIFRSETPWGGSMVLRRSVLDSGLTDRWSRTLSDDVSTSRHLKRSGLSLVCVPEVTVVNHESISIRDCIHFVCRQTLMLKLYHPDWHYVMAMTLGGTALRVWLLVLLARSMWQMDLVATASLIAVLPLSRHIMRFQVTRLDRAVRAKVQETGREIPVNPLPSAIEFLCTEILFLTSVLFALTARSILWRGIRYQIDGPEGIYMQNYQPYQRISTDADATVI